MMRTTTAFLRGEVAASNQARKKTLPAWKQQEDGRKLNFDKRGDFRIQQRSKRRRDKFTLLTKFPREILALDKGKFKAPPPIQIEELIKAGKLSHIIKELKHGSEKDQPKAANKVKAPEKDKSMTILMVHPWQRVARQRITQSFSPDLEITFPPLGDEDGTSEKPNASSHRTPHWFQRRNHMANGIHITTGKNRGCEIFNLYMDELCDRGILTLRSSKIMPLECTMVSGPEAQPSASTRVAKEKIKVTIHPEYPEQTIAIGSTLTEEGRRELWDLLRRNLDIFAWKPTNMTEVPRHIAEHRLNICEGCPQVRQKKRSQAPEKNKAIQEEVERLVEAGIMKEVHYHRWLSNSAMVKKHDDSWRMCVDFKDLNKACPKDGYPLPRRIQRIPPN
ncbi:hypothetical protein Tco_1532235 [Tanacetum coccineum]